MDFKIDIDGVRYENYLTLPLDIQSTLDESLDIGHITLSLMDRAEPFLPMTTVRITVFGQKSSNDYRLLVANDTVTKVQSVNKYTHNISLIEETKKLERITGLTKTNTTPLVEDIEETKQYINIINTNLPSGTSQILSTTTQVFAPTYEIKSPFDLDTINLPSGADFFKAVPETIASFNNGEVYYNNEKVMSIPTFEAVSIPVNGRLGDWRAEYHSSSSIATYKYIINFTVIEKVKPVEINYTIKDVVERLLKTAICERGGSNDFQLDWRQEEELAKIPAPDFALNGTLWECLSEIGKYIHCIPKIIFGNRVHFEKLGNNERVTEKEKEAMESTSSNTQQFDIEQYAIVLDSTVDNIVNTDIRDEGTVKTPYSQGWKTVRTDTGTVMLTDENILIETEEPIEELIKLECGYISDKSITTFDVGDITPYVFESAEYDALSKFDIGYPLSRNFALKYTQGQKHIKGLNYKSPNAISPVFTEYSIKNIIARKLQIPVSQISNEDIKKLQFRVTYIPIVSARVQQEKSCYEDYRGDYETSMLDYNQTANKVNSKAYGENMKGVIARLGNPDKAIVYYTTEFDEIPKVGVLYDDNHYISIVKTEAYNDFMKVEVVLSKDFNRLNEYVGINKQKRFYEVSEKQSVDRYINYKDYVIIQKASNYPLGQGQPLITEKGLIRFANSFENRKPTEFPTEIGSARVQGISNLQSGLPEVLLPTVSLGMGNAMVFSFHFEDNYSAGNTREERNNAQLQYQLRYTDIYGRIDNMNLKLGINTQKIRGAYEYAVQYGNRLPYADGAVATVLFDTGDRPLTILKDNREKLYFTYQINFVTEDRSFVIGSALASKCSFVTNKITKYKVYILPERIGKFQNDIDTANATLLLDGYEDGAVGVDTRYYSVTLPKLTANADGKAWAIVTEDNELVLGQNIDIVNGGEIAPTKLRFVHQVK